MIRKLQSPESSFPWFAIGMVGIFLVSLALRFWGLSRFNTLVFDEVYYAKFAAAFLQGRQDFGGHPPLSTYIIAGGIWLANHFGWGDLSNKNELTGLMLSTFSYRWLNALTGSFIPLVVGAIAYQLMYRRSYAFLAALLAAADGMFLVESRYALNNVYLVLFGLLGYWLFLLTLGAIDRQRERWRVWLYLILAGISFGASVGIKWNGVGFLLGPYALWGTAWIVRWLSARKPQAEADLFIPQPFSSPLEQLTRLNLIQMMVGLGWVPVLTYFLSWIPYIQLDPSTSIWGWQAKILDYHHRVGGMDVHPYCSPWYSWLLMVRPVAYFYKSSLNLGEDAAVVGPLPPSNGQEIIFDVHAMGNPILWWLSTAAIALLIALVIYRAWGWFRTRDRQDPLQTVSALPWTPAYTWTAFFLVAGWGTNLLLWLQVSRCTFLYHYMGSSIFALLAIALLIDRWLQSPLNWHRAVGVTVTFLILAAFVFWMPLYLGLPISPEEIRLRRWFQTWV